MYENISQMIEIPAARPLIPSLKFRQLISSKIDNIVKKREYLAKSTFFLKNEKYKV
jgi:hypothetical protein